MTFRKNDKVAVTFFDYEEKGYVPSQIDTVVKVTPTGVIRVAGGALYDAAGWSKSGKDGQLQLLATPEELMTAQAAVEARQAKLAERKRVQLELHQNREEIEKALWAEKMAEAQRRYGLEVDAAVEVWRQPDLKVVTLETRRGVVTLIIRTRPYDDLCFLSGKLESVEKAAVSVTSFAPDKYDHNALAERSHGMVRASTWQEGVLAVIAQNFIDYNWKGGDKWE